MAKTQANNDTLTMNLKNKGQTIATSIIDDMFTEGKYVNEEEIRRKLRFP